MLLTITNIIQQTSTLYNRFEIFLSTQYQLYVYLFFIKKLSIWSQVTNAIC